MFFRSIVLLVVFRNGAAADDNVERPQIYLSQDKVPFVEALNKCHQARMRLVGSSSDLGFINKLFFADLTEKSNTSEQQSEYWFLNTKHYWSHYRQPPNAWSPCQTLIAKFQGGNTSATFGYDSCRKPHRYICENPQRNQAEIDGFLVSANTTLDFLDASKVCKIHNRQLAYVDNERENIELTHLIRKELGIKTGLFWIGAIYLRINEEFRWYPSNKYLTYSNWLHKLEANETCAAMAFHEDRVASPWLQVSCEQKLRFVCRKPLPKKCENWIPNPEMPHRVESPGRERATGLRELTDWTNGRCADDQTEDRIKNF